MEFGFDLDLWILVTMTSIVPSAAAIVDLFQSAASIQRPAASGVWFLQHMALRNQEGRKW